MQNGEITNIEEAEEAIIELINKQSELLKRFKKDERFGQKLKDFIWSEFVKKCVSDNPD